MRFEDTDFKCNLPNFMQGRPQGARPTVTLSPSPPLKPPFPEMILIFDANMYDL